MIDCCIRRLFNVCVSVMEVTYLSREIENILLSDQQEGDWELNSPGLDLHGRNSEGPLK